MPDPVNENVTAVEGGPEADPEARTIHQRMVGVARDVGAIAKDQRNEDSGYAARGIDDVLNRIHDVLVKHEVALYPVVEDVKYRDVPSKGGGRQHEACIRVRYRFVGPDGDAVELVGASEALDSSDKATNKAMSATLKYVLLHAFTIPLIGKDGDSDASTPERGTEDAPEFGGAPKELLDRIVATVAELRDLGVQVDAQGWTVLGVELVRNRRANVDELTAEGVLARLELLRPPPAPPEPEPAPLPVGDDGEPNERALIPEGEPSADGAVAADPECPRCGTPLTGGNVLQMKASEEGGDGVRCSQCFDDPE